MGDWLVGIDLDFHLILLLLFLSSLILYNSYSHTASLNVARPPPPTTYLRAGRLLAEAGVPGLQRPSPSGVARR